MQPQNPYPHKIGLFGIGLDTYWEQFEGLEERLLGYVERVAGVLTETTGDTEIVNVGLVDTVDRAFAAGHHFRREEVNLIFLYVTTYALSSTVLPVVRLAGVPVVVLNLAPEPAMDYEYINHLNDRTRMTGEWLAHCSACPVPEIANVLRRAGIPFRELTGILDDPTTHRELSAWTTAARVAHELAHLRTGLMGHYYNGMLDIYTDTTQLLATFGGHFEIVEVDELSALRRDVTEAAVAERIDLFRENFDVQPDCPEIELRRAARTSVALDRMVDTYRLGALAYYYKGSGVAENEDTLSSIIVGTSLLTARHVPVAGEYEIKNVLAMKILDLLEAGGSFTEFYGVDYNDEVILMGHDGPGHLRIAEGRTKVKPLQVYHGKVGRGLSVEMSVRHGPVTLLSVVQPGDGSVFLLVAEGESVPGSILEIGNTNSRYRFGLGVREFLQAWNRHGPAHHCAVGIGHRSNDLRKLGSLLGIEVVVIG